MFSVTIPVSMPVIEIVAGALKTVRIKSVEIELLPLFAVNLMEILPTSLLLGVPLNVRVDASNFSQFGKVDPSNDVAVYVKLLFEEFL